MARTNDKLKLIGHYRERVYRLVRRIPSGRVMTYGQIAVNLGEGYTPRTVGFVMHGANEENTPWHRVINSQGGCSTGRIVLPPDKQQRMLEAEGIEFDAQGRCDLERYLWHLNAKAAKDFAEVRKGKGESNPTVREGKLALRKGRKRKVLVA
jgi:methylated-DNA-protein-cysteine methyltransferase-like protein